MEYRSTRGKSGLLLFSQAVERSLAPDGGLYVPTGFPSLTFRNGAPLAEVASTALAPFVDLVASDLRAVCDEALNFPVPLKALRPGTSVLELFHGPTAAFKDVGARFLAGTLSRLRKADGPVTTILVATSGDTGGAVAAAFHGVPGIEVVVLYPKGRVSARQEKQLTAWGGNVRAFAVRGHFDDCQRMVKEGLGSPSEERRFLSANSINIGRLLPQMAYYVRASVEHRTATGRDPGFVIPSGNLGNAVAAMWARKIGAPIGRITLATNANRALGEYFASGVWKSFQTVETLANAMDVGAPSNMERALDLYRSISEFREGLSVISVTDDQIRETIRAGESRYGEIWCPHTATAVFARESLPAAEDWIVVATAHPAKFETIVEPLIGHAVPVPVALEEILARPSRVEEIGPAWNEARDAL